MTTWITFYAWSMALIYPAINAAILVAALYGSRQPAFRRPFYWLATAAALSVFCAAVTLFLRLHRSFAFPFVTAELQRGLLLPHDLAEVASLVVYCVGFFGLVHRVRAGSPTTPVA